MAGNLIVDEEAVLAMTRGLAESTKKTDEILDQYLALMGRLKEEALQEGAAAAALSSYLHYAGAIRGRLEEISEALAVFGERYIADIDEADSYLF